MRVVAAHHIPEVAQASAKRPPDFGEPLRTEHQQRDHENEEEMGRLEDVANHCRQLSPPRARRAIFAREPLFGGPE